MKKTEHRKGSFYWKSLVLVLAITCLPALLIGIGIYNFGAEPIVRELNQAHQEQLNQSIRQTDEYLSRLELFSAQLAFNPEFDESLASLNFAEQFQKTKDLYLSLALMKDSNPLIFDVAFYLKDSGKVISDHWGVRTLQSEDSVRAFQALLDTDRKIYWTDSLAKLDPNHSSYKGVVTKLYPTFSDQPFGAFLIYLNQGALDQLVSPLAAADGNAFLMNPDGSILSAHDHGDIGLRETLTKRILAMEASQDTFVYKWKDTSYSVSYGHLSRLGKDWIYVSATPLDRITAPVNDMSRMIVAVSAFGLALALLLSWFASKRIYNPIQRLVGLFHSAKETGSDRMNEIAYIERQWKLQLDESELLQGQLQQSLPSLREGYLLQFLQGRIMPFSDQEVIEKLRQYEWNVEGTRFAFLVAGLYGKGTPAAKFSDRDEQLIDYAAANIMQELCRTAAVHAHAINFQNSTVGVLLAIDNSVPAPKAKETLLALAADIASALSGLLKVNVAIAVGKLTDSALALPGLLDETSKTLRRRDPNEPIDLLDVEDMLPDMGPIDFPLELEKDIIQSMRMGLSEEAADGVQRFVEAIRSKAGTQMHVQQAMLKLLGSVYDAVFRAGMNPDSVYGGAHLYEDLMRLRNPDEMIRWFSVSVIEPFVRSATSSFDSETRSIVDRVVEELHRDLLTDVSLDLYASRYGISSFKLSRSFKQVKGVNFIDYLTGLRIEKCKELLLTTDMKVNDIAEALRYQPSYLIRLFKKSTELTPGQFREKFSRSPG
ncbi:AraC family transcriptional regulator [Paenibacillus oceani]|uniref:AraC family transcriptional regulator n=1 Tax=Paenibacillus oceani TaxID=2772510 RepID=A0A927CA21_9BACL|nr:AraC family transcriptional regulator [Paenibacillus oceani]MBD2862887.1 AraC family transcriptional regulator [Paenibacillus oceani]